MRRCSEHPEQTSGQNVQLTPVFDIYLDAVLLPYSKQGIIAIQRSLT
jgi:hypothetical protein